MKEERGLFITFEGGEGSGKSTQARLLHEHLTSRGLKVIVSREPGGTIAGERIRKILLHPESAGLDPLAELFLYLAARREHMEKIVRPALEGKVTVILDRFCDATLAYQGHGRGLDLKLIRELNENVCAGLRPDITFLLHFHYPRDGLTRARRRQVETDQGKNEDRFERETLAFHERVREGYRSLAEEDPGRIKVIDARGSIEEIHRAVLDILEKQYPQRL